MLAKNNQGTSIEPNVETELVVWVSDGSRQLIGFCGTGSWSAEFRLYVGTDSDPWYVQQTSPAVRSAYVADRGTKLPSGTRVVLKVYHEAPEAQLFKGTILGG